MWARGLHEASAGRLASVPTQHVALHVFAREDRDFNTTVFLTAGLGLVAVDRLGLTHAHCGDPVGRESATYEEAAGGVSATLRQPLIVGGFSGRVRVSDNENVGSLCLPVGVKPTTSLRRQ